MIPIRVVDIMRDIVQSVSTVLTPSLQLFDPNIQGVFYEFGHPVEIIQTLAQKDQNQTQRFRKYPLVCLFTDFDQEEGQQIGIDNTSTLQIVIVYHTKNTYVAAEREVKTFKPVLVPIYYELINQIYLHPLTALQTGQLLSRRRKDRYFWGKEGLYGSEANIFNDYLDAIEIRNMRLSFYPQIC